MSEYQRSLAVECPHCHTAAKIYVNVDSVAGTAVCPACGKEVEITSDWKEWMAVFDSFSRNIK